MSSIINKMSTSLKSWWAYEFLGALFILMAILISVFPAHGYVGLVGYFILTFFLSGAVRLSTAIANRGVMRNWRWYAAAGILDLALAILLLYRIDVAAVVLIFYIGFFIMLMSFGILFKAWDLRSIGNSAWKWTLTIGILGLILSILILTNPIVGASLALTWAAIGFASFGAFYIYLGVQLRKVYTLTKDNFLGLMF